MSVHGLTVTDPIEVPEHDILISVSDGKLARASSQRARIITNAFLSASSNLVISLPFTTRYA